MHRQLALFLYITAALSSHWSNQAWVRESAFWPSLLDVRTNPTFFLVIVCGAGALLGKRMGALFRV